MIEIKDCSINAALETAGKKAVVALSPAPDLSACLTAAHTRLPGFRIGRNTHRVRLLLAMLALLIPGVTLPILAQTGGREKVPGVYLKFNLPIPAYLSTSMSELSRGNGYLNLLTKKLESWNKQHQWKGGPQPLAMLSFRGADSEPDDEAISPLLKNFVVQIFLASGEESLISSLNECLATPTDGLPAILPFNPTNAKPKLRFYEPGAEEHYELFVDGQKLDYPDDFTRTERAVLGGYLHQMDRLGRLLTYRWHKDIETPGRIGQLFILEKNEDGVPSVRTLNQPEALSKLDPPTGDSSSISIVLWGHQDDASAIDSLMEAAKARRKTPPMELKTISGRLLTYPLLASQRWEPGHEADYYVLTPADVKSTTDLLRVYRKAVSAWLKDHPQFADSDLESDILYLTEYSDSLLQQDPQIKQGKSESGSSEIKLCLKVFVNTQDKALLEELRRLLDGVPGVAARVERNASMVSTSDGWIDIW